MKLRPLNIKVNIKKPGTIPTRRLFSSFFILVLIVFSLTSCPAPISEDDLSQVQDTIGPVITVLSPEDGSPYAKTVVVEGIVTDSSGDTEKPGEVRVLSYEILGTLIGEEVSIERDGSFSFQFATSGFAGPVVLRITAKDWNGNTGETSLTLDDAGCDIPSFTAIPGSHQVTLTWDPVPLAEGYTLYYTTNGNMPSEYYGKFIDGVESPYVITGLENGNMHVFILKASSPAGFDDSWSDYQKAIPLSLYTLAPRVRGEYRQIRIDWPDIPATDEFQVWRADSKGGPYSNYSGTITGTSFIDTGVEEGYYYRVRPALEGSVESCPSFGRPSIFPPKGGERIGWCNTPGSARGVVIRGDYAHVADFEEGLQIINIADPSAPFITGSCATPDRAYDVAVSGNYAYIANYDSGLQVIDISDLHHPFIAGSTDIPQAAQAVAVQGDFAYVAENYIGLRIVDVSDPGEPEPRGLFPIGSSILDVDVSGDFVYVAAWTDLYKVNITDADNPVEEDSTAHPIGAHGVAVGGGYVYVADYSGDFRVYEESTLDWKADITDLGSLHSVVLYGDRAYISDYSMGLHVADISNPLSPVLMATFNTTGKAYDVAFTGDLAVIADGLSGVQIIDTVFPYSLSSAGYCPTTGSTRELAVSENYAYIAEGSWVDVVGISDPETPDVAGTCDIAGCGAGADGAALVGDYLIVPDYCAGIEVLDVSRPSTPTIAGTCGSSSPALHAVIWGDYAFVTVGFDGLQVIDISTPGDPDTAAYTSSLYDPSNNYYFIDVCISGHYAFVTEYYSTISYRLEIFDISDPSSPASVGSCAIASNGWGLTVCDDYVYIACGSSGLEIVDVSDPENPVTTAGSPHATASTAYDVTVVDSYAYMAVHDAGMQIIDISDPDSPSDAASLDTPGSARDVAVSGRYAYIADYTSGLQVIDLY